jgi:hypothetical protein
MENLQLITATVLITLISGALVGSLIYLGVVVRKLRRTVNNNVLDVRSLEDALNVEMQNAHGRIDGISKETDDRLKELSDRWNHNSSEMDRKIDSRYDKLSSDTSNQLSNLIRKVNTAETDLLNRISDLEEVKTK